MTEAMPPADRPRVPPPALNGVPYGGDTGEPRPDGEREEEPAGVWRDRSWLGPLTARPWTVAVTALCCVAVIAARLGLTAYLPAYALLGVAGTALAFVDAAIRRLPDPLTLPSYPAGLALLAAAVPATAHGGDHLLHAVYGMAALWGFYAVQYVIAPGKVGRGDVKLAGVLGLYLGWLGLKAVVFGVFAIHLLAGFYALGLLVTRRAGPGSQFPFGPFMLIGTLAAILAAGPV